MIDDLIAHLSAELTGFKRVTHAKDQKPVKDVPTDIPLIGVFPGADGTERDGTDFLESKMVTSVVLVHLLCDISELELRKQALRTAAIGWTPGPYNTNLALDSGNMLQLNGGVAWWEDQYSTRRQIRESY